MKILKASVTFQQGYDYQFGGKEYVFITNLTDLVKGDLVVVETSKGMQVTRFERYIEDQEINATKSILSKIKQLEDSTEICEENNRQLILKQRIKERIKQVEYLAHVKKLAKEDAELASMVKELYGE